MPTSRDLSARCPTGLLPNRRRPRRREKSPTAGRRFRREERRLIAGRVTISGSLQATSPATPEVATHPQRPRNANALPKHSRMKGLCRRNSERPSLSIDSRIFRSPTLKETTATAEWNFPSLSPPSTGRPSYAAREPHPRYRAEDVKVRYSVEISPDSYANIRDMLGSSYPS